MAPSPPTARPLLCKLVRTGQVELHRHCSHLYTLISDYPKDQTLLGSEKNVFPWGLVLQCSPDQTEAWQTSDDLSPDVKVIGFIMNQAEVGCARWDVMFLIHPLTHLKPTYYHKYLDHWPILS